MACVRALIIGESKLPADLSGGLTRPQNVLICGKKQEQDNSVLANTVHSFIDCSWFCERGVLACRKSDTSNSSATENVKYTDNLGRHRAALYFSVGR